MHSWKDLVFDISSTGHREQFAEEHGVTLPLTHEVAPIEHANKCSEFASGSIGVDGYDWLVWARVALDTSQTITEDGDGKAHPDVDFSTLSESLDMMLRAAAHAERESLPASERLSKPPPSKPKTAAKRRK